MKLILKIDAKTFEEIRQQMTSDSLTDYYKTNRHSDYHSQGEYHCSVDGYLIENEEELEFIEKVKQVQSLKFPFNIFKEVKNFTYGEDANRPIECGMDYCIITTWGYKIDEKNSVYAYSSCRSNFHGVYKDGDSYYYFVSGRRHWALGAAYYNFSEYLHLRDSEIVLYETTMPEMKFWETN